MAMERFVPRVFISYSWDNEAHKSRVKDLAARLRGDGVDVTLDEWHVRPATRLPHFMESAVRDNDFIFIVCTERLSPKGRRENRWRRLRGRDYYRRIEPVGRHMIRRV